MGRLVFPRPAHRVHVSFTAVVHYNCTGAVTSFFFQAEGGIRDPLVTGVQTCALPISLGGDTMTDTCPCAQGGPDGADEPTGRELSLRRKRHDSDAYRGSGHLRGTSADARRAGLPDRGEADDGAPVPSQSAVA